MRGPSVCERVTHRTNPGGPHSCRSSVLLYLPFHVYSHLFSESFSAVTVASHSFPLPLPEQAEVGVKPASTSFDAWCSASKTTLHQSIRLGLWPDNTTLFLT